MQQPEPGKLNKISRDPLLSALPNADRAMVVTELEGTTYCPGMDEKGQS